MRSLLVAGSLILALGCTSQNNTQSSVAVSGNESSEIFQVLNIGNKVFGLKGTKKIVLTIDDGPSAQTMDILKLLKAYNIKADFFINGKNAPKYGYSLPQLVKDGHNLSNHSEHHHKLRKLSAEQVIEEIAATDRVIRKYARKDQPLYFRAPGGGWNYSDNVSPEILRAIPVMNADPRLSRYIGPVFWSAGGELNYHEDGSIKHAADWDCWVKDVPVETCAQGYVNEVEAQQGGVVLVHDKDVETVQMLKLLIPYWLENGYEFISLEALPKLNAM